MVKWDHMKQEATFGAGCFWGVEEAFRVTKGVLMTEVGFMGGRLKDPSYEDVSYKETGHAEVVHVEFDSDLISYVQLLQVFWRSHNPTEVNRQGPDIGSQYRSVIFYHTEEQKRLAEASKQDLEASGKWSRPIATDIEPADLFYRAEDYHQKYLMKRGKTTC